MWSFISINITSTEEWITAALTTDLSVAFLNVAHESPLHFRWELGCSGNLLYEHILQAMLAKDALQGRSSQPLCFCYYICSGYFQIYSLNLRNYSFDHSLRVISAKLVSRILKIHSIHELWSHEAINVSRSSTSAHHSQMCCHTGCQWNSDW